MGLKLDHVVHLVQDLGTATDTLRRLGLHVVPGGEHPAWGTHNALSYYDLTYIELMAIKEPETAANSDLGGAALQTLTRFGEGLATVALATADIAGAVATMKARGTAVSGPFPGSRRRPDGSVVAWQLALPPWPWPFLIQWEAPEPERRADLTARSVIRPHPLGENLQLRQVAWAVQDLARGAAWLQDAYGLTAGEPFQDEQLGARCAASPAGILLCEPTGPGPARDRLAQRGEGPFLIDFTTESKAGRLIRPDQAHGAWLRVSAP